jgi:hypothetical protein
MDNRDVLIEVGKLAGLVSGQLHAVDKSTTNHNSHGGPANKININSFINSIKSNSLPSTTLSSNHPTIFSQAYVDEAQVQMMEPDVSRFSVKLENLPEASHQNISFQNPHSQPENREFQKINTPASIPTGVDFSEVVDDIKSIKSTLNSINSTFTKISGMMGKVFNYITEKERKGPKA